MRVIAIKMWVVCKVCVCERRLQAADKECQNRTSATEQPANQHPPVSLDLSRSSSCSSSSFGGASGDDSSAGSVTEPPVTEYSIGGDTTAVAAAASSSGDSGSPTSGETAEFDSVACIHPHEKLSILQPAGTRPASNQRPASKIAVATMTPTAINCQVARSRLLLLLLLPLLLPNFHHLLFLIGC